VLGEGDEKDFQESNVSTALFVMFLFLCVILLANVLIAIVTDSYKKVCQESTRGHFVFWTNRLDFVAEMDASLRMDRGSDEQCPQLVERRHQKDL
jgi:hypothetical protein